MLSIPSKLFDLNVLPLSLSKASTSCRVWAWGVMNFSRIGGIAVEMGGGESGALYRISARALKGM